MTMVLWRVADVLFTFGVNYKKYPVDKMAAWAKHTEVSLSAIGCHHASESDDVFNMSCDEVMKTAYDAIGDHEVAEIIGGANRRMLMLEQHVEYIGQEKLAKNEFAGELMDLVAFFSDSHKFFLSRYIMIDIIQ